MKRDASRVVRRLLALALCLTMLLPLFSSIVSAAQTADAEPVVVTEETPDAELTVEPTDEPVADEPDAEATVGIADETDSVDADTNATGEAEISPLATGGITMGGVTLPAYSGGTTSSVMEYDCGYSTVTDGSASKSYMAIVTGTTEDQFKTYVSTLISNGYNKTYEKTVAAQSGNNLFAKFVVGTHSVYTYYTAYYNETRIILDTNPDTTGSFTYTPQSGGDGKAEVYMYALSMADNGWDSVNDKSNSVQMRRNCGQLIIVKMPDNSLFINDGGGIEQMSDKACADLLAFCRMITGVPQGQKMVINTWFISHSHRDHYSGLPRFLAKYASQFELENILYNFEDNYGEDFHTGSHPYVQVVSELYPNANYYKPHTGEHFDIDGVQIDVLYTTEDRFDVTNGAPAVYESHKNFNDTSAALMISYGDKKILLAGDLAYMDARMMNMYPAAYLQADILQGRIMALITILRFVRRLRRRILSLRSRNLRLMQENL